MNRLLLFGLLTIIIGCNSKAVMEASASMDKISENYVKLVLEIGQYDSDFVDAYYGPEEWKPEALGEIQKSGFTSEVYIKQCNTLQEQLAMIDTSQFDELEKSRYVMLGKQLHAVVTKTSMMGGELLKFDQEAISLYDATPPTYSQDYFDSLLTNLDILLTGEGSISERYESFAKDFIIPKELLDTVFQTAITEARKRTNHYFDLPDNENFEVAYVTDKAWSGYNYFQGNAYSLIQINTDFPIFIERAIDLACHEGYPGHHVFNAMLEKELVNKRGWKEFSVYPLFSPQSLIAEGSANYGIEVAFPSEERLEYEKNVLFPLAGLDSSKAELYYDIQALRSELDYAGNEAARLYLNGEISRDSAAIWLNKYLLYEPDRALQRTRFFDKYRSYVINYNLGKDLVAHHMEKNIGKEGGADKRWQTFKEVLSTPRTASLLE